MNELISSGRVVDIILAVLAIEAVALILWRGNKSALKVFSALLPGALLLLALKAALQDAPAFMIGACLAASFPAHLLDLRLRRV